MKRNPIINGVDTAPGATVNVSIGAEVTCAPSHAWLESVPAGQSLAPDQRLPTRANQPNIQYEVATFVPSKAGTYRLRFTESTLANAFRGGYVDIVAS